MSERSMLLFALALVAAMAFAATATAQEEGDESFLNEGDSECPEGFVAAGDYCYTQTDYEVVQEGLCDGAPTTEEFLACLEEAEPGLADDAPRTPATDQQQYEEPPAADQEQYEEPPAIGDEPAEPAVDRDEDPYAEPSANEPEVETLPETGGASTVMLAAGLTLLAGGLMAHKVVR